MKKFYLFVAFILVIIVAVYGVAKRQAPTVNSNGTISVVGSFYPMAHFAGVVGGDKVNVTNITPAGAEPHDFEPTAQDIAKVYQSKLFIYNGNGIDAWADKIAPDVTKHGVTALRMSDSMQSLQDPENPEVTHQYDPHFWLDPVLAQQEVGLIASDLAMVDPVNADYYRQNAQNYTNQLSALDKDFQTGLNQCQSHDIVTSHAAFGYLAKRYNLNQIAIAGLSPDSEPSPKRLAQIADLVRQKNIHYIFFEDLISPKLAQTIATETGAQTISFNPLEGLTNDQIKAGQTYITIMQSNLSNLKIALQCQ